MGRIFRSTGIVALSTLASRILGLARDILMAALFSATGATDAFYAAFRVPNLARRLVSEGVLTVSFIPVYTGYRTARGGREALELAQKTLTALLVVSSVIAAAGIVFAPGIVSGLAMGFEDHARIERTIVMFRIMFPYVAIAGVLAFCMGVLNSHRSFFAPAFAPVLLNVGIISGILFAGGMFTDPLYGVAAGVLAGGVLQIALQVPFMARAGFRMKLSLDMRHPGLGKIFRTSLLGIAGMGVHQINILVATLLGSYLADGSISYIYFSDRLHELVLGVTVVSIGNVMLPEMSAHAAREDAGALVGAYRASVRSALFFAIPATAALMIVGFPIISVLLMHNRFTALEAEMTYRALFYASAGIVGMAVARLTAPVYFALGDARTPFCRGRWSFTVNAAVRVGADADAPAARGSDARGRDSGDAAGVHTDGPSSAKGGECGIRLDARFDPEKRCRGRDHGRCHMGAVGGDGLENGGVRGTACRPSGNRSGRGSGVSRRKLRAGR